MTKPEDAKKTRVRSAPETPAAALDCSRGRGLHEIRNRNKTRPSPRSIRFRETAGAVRDHWQSRSSRRERAVARTERGRSMRLGVLRTARAKSSHEFRLAGTRAGLPCTACGPGIIAEGPRTVKVMLPSFPRIWQEPDRARNQPARSIARTPPRDRADSPLKQTRDDPIQTPLHRPAGSSPARRLPRRYFQWKSVESPGGAAVGLRRPRGTRSRRLDQSPAASPNNDARGSRKPGIIGSPWRSSPSWRIFTSVGEW